MKKFEFTLDTVLKYRRHKEKKAQVDLGSARREGRDIQFRIDQLIQEKDRMRARLKKDTRAGVSAGWYLSCQNFVGRLDQELKAARIDLEKQQEKIEALRTDLRKQYSKKESLECLKTTCAEAHKKCVESEWQKSSDELVLLQKGGVL